MRIVFALLFIGVWYFFFQKIIEKYWDRNLTVIVRCNRDYAYEGDELKLVEEIVNQKYLILPALKVKFTTSKYWDFHEENGTTTDQYYRNDVFSVGMNEKLQRVLPFTCRKRGYYVLGNVDIFVSDYFYTREFIRRQKGEQWVYVFPKRVYTPQVEEAFQKIMGNVAAKKRCYEDPFLFAGIRDYQSYDTMRQINWKASAKTGALKVNRLEHTAELSVHIVVFFERENVVRDKAMEEQIIRLAASLAERLLAKQVPVSLRCNGLDVESGKEIVIGAGSGENHMRCVDEGLARINLEEGGSNMEGAAAFLDKAIEGQALNVLLSTDQTAVFQETLLQKMQEEISFLWLLPHYATEPVNVRAELTEQLVELITDLE